MGKLKAFTLIELLVVIAIIAILAAILFPVFAQAKDSAKDTQTLSNVKQTGTAILMYNSDYDDLFPLSMLSHPVQPIDLAWQDLCQPYIKNWQMLIHVKRQPPRGAQVYQEWQRSQYYAIPPRAIINRRAEIRTRGYYVWQHATLTGNQQVRFDGIAGFGNLGEPQADWLGRFAGASMSQTQIENISENIMAAEAANWDFWWSLGNVTEGYAYKYCVKWIPDPYNSFAPNYGFAGPNAYKRTKQGKHGTGPVCTYPDGMTTYVATDGSAKARDFRGRILERKQRADGSWIFVRQYPLTQD